MSEHKQIKDILLDHKGKKNGIKSPKLAELIGIDPGPSNVTIRKLILETMKKYQLPIAGNPALGYYIIENKKELNESLKSLDSRIHEITNRKALIFHLYHKFYNLEALELTKEISGIDISDFEEEGDNLVL